MSIQYPTALDSFQNPGATDREDASGLEHDLQHANANDAIAALQAKLGIDNSAVTTSVDYFIKNFFTQGHGAPASTPALSRALYIDEDNGALYTWWNSAWH